VVFGLVMVAAIPTAVSFAVMNKRRPSAGGAFTWLWEAVAPPVGAWLGWVQATQYTLACVLQPIMFGLFCNALLAGVGAPPSFTTAMAGGLVVVALVAVATYRQVQVSARVVGVFMVIEAAFVAALAVVIIVAQAMRGGLSTAPLDPAAATSGPHGVIAAGPRLIRLAANATPGTYGPERLAAGQVSVTPCAATVLAAGLLGPGVPVTCERLP